jgi:hypothetical protein
LPETTECQYGQELHAIALRLIRFTMTASASIPLHLHRRRSIGVGVIFTLLVWVLSCSGAVAGVPGIMHVQPETPAAHHQHRPTSPHGNDPDDCCSLLTKLPAPTAAAVFKAPAFSPLVGVSPLPSILTESSSDAPANPAPFDWILPPPLRPFLAHLSWPNAPPV